MKLAFASDDQVHLAAHTGRCNGFVIVSFGEGTWTREDFRGNPMSRHHQERQEEQPHRAGESAHSHHPLLEALHDCTGLVTRGLGPRLVADLQSADKCVYVSPVPTIEEAAGLIAAGRLTPSSGTGDCSHG